jgi:DNA-binding LacI/PurR family transcriptional regulator/DNA-binding CsgD family transcriptional regulator/PAS domain-containing protein
MGTAGRKQPIIGLLINQIEGRYQSLIRRGLSDFAVNRGVSLRLYVGRSLASPYGNEDTHNHIYGLARGTTHEAPPDGLVVTVGSIGNYLPPEGIVRFLESFCPLPLVTIGMDVPGFTGITSDNKPGISAAVDHLIKVHGYRRIAFLSGPDNSPDACDRLEAWKGALLAAGIEPDNRLVYHGDFSYRSSQQLAASLDLSGGIPFDAIVSANDDMALGFMKTLESRGFTSPRDFAITGFDDIPDARFLSPPLTTIHQPLYEQAVRAGERLLALMEGGRAFDPSDKGCFPCELVIRESCGCPDIPLIPNRQYRGAEQGDTPPLSLKSSVVTAVARELSLPVQSQGQTGEALAALADTVTLDLRTYRDRPLFLQTLADWFDLTSGWEDFSGDWHRILSLFHRELLKSLSDPRARSYVEDLFQSAFALLTRKAGEHDARELSVLRNTLALYRDLSWRLGTVTGLDGLLETLRLLTPLIGFSRVDLALHEGGPIPLGEPSPEPFYGRMTIHETLSTGTISEKIIMPLLTRDTSFGYISLEGAGLDPLVFDTLRDQVSQTLGAIHLWQEGNRAAEALKKSEERYRDIASAVPMMVIETDRNLDVRYINPAGREGLGLEKGEDRVNLRLHLNPEDRVLADDMVRRMDKVRLLNMPGIRLMNPVRHRFVPVVSIAGIFASDGTLSGLRWNALDPLPLLSGGILPDSKFFHDRKVTGRELEVIELQLQGFRIRDIADKLCIAESTVKGHLTQVYDKLGISGKGELLHMLREEQVGRHGFSAYVFSLVNRLLSMDGD